MLERRDTRMGQKGFTLVELLIVLAIIAILASISIAGYIGMQNRVRRMVLIATSASAESELQAWLNSALKSQKTLNEVDSTGEGRITTIDADNAQLGLWLASGDLDAAYVNARVATYNEQSPWFPGLDLWKSDDVADGRIAIKSSTSIPFVIRMHALDEQGRTLYLKTIYAD